MAIVRGVERNEVRIDGLQDTGHHNGEGHLHEGPAVGVGRYGTASPDAERQGQHEVERDLVDNDHEDGPTAESQHTAHGLVTHIKSQADSTETAGRQRGNQDKELCEETERRAEREQGEFPRTEYRGHRW